MMSDADQSSDLVPVERSGESGEEVLEVMNANAERILSKEKGQLARIPLTEAPMPRLITFSAEGTLYEKKEFEGVILRDLVQKHFGTLCPYLPRPESFQAEYERALKEMSRRHPCYGATTDMTSAEWWIQVYAKTVMNVLRDDDKIYSLPVDQSLFESTNDSGWEAFYSEAYFNLWGKGSGSYTQYILTPECENVLNFLKTDKVARGTKLGVISNHDERLPEILFELGISHYFDFVLSSREIGSEKPSRVLWDLAMHHGCQEDPKYCLHIGEDLEKDVVPAVTCRWQAMLYRQPTFDDSPEEALGSHDLRAGVDYRIANDLWALLKPYNMPIYHLKVPTNHIHTVDMHSNPVDPEWNF